MSYIKVTTLVCGWSKVNSSKLKCQIRVFHLGFPNIPYCFADSEYNRWHEVNELINFLDFNVIKRKKRNKSVAFASINETLSIFII